jgi:GT2 family glycosyltransferase
MKVFGRQREHNFALGNIAMALVTIIIVNHNGSSLLEDCLNSLVDQIFTNYEVILVDNGSTDNSLQTVARILPRIKILSLGENTGWAKANNIGIRSANSEFVVLLNNDTVPPRIY